MESRDRKRLNRFSEKLKSVAGELFEYEHNSYINTDFGSMERFEFFSKEILGCVEFYENGYILCEVGSARTGKYIVGPELLEPLSDCELAEFFDLNIFQNKKIFQ